MEYAGGGMTLGAPDRDYAAYPNWLMHGEATLTFPQTLVLRYAVLEPRERRQPDAAEHYRRWFLMRLRLLEARLRKLETRDGSCAAKAAQAASQGGKQLDATPHKAVAGLGGFPVQPRTYGGAARPAQQNPAPRAPPRAPPPPASPSAGNRCRASASRCWLIPTPHSSNSRGPAAIVSTAMIPRSRSPAAASSPGSASSLACAR